MKERPILFSTEMVSAILANRKTQTRRIVKGIALDWLAPDMFTPKFVASEDNKVCPYGYENDILWVRETWALYNLGGQKYIYKADNVEYANPKWKPSIHMPKEACRIRLKIKSVRVERLSDISEQDAIAEGIELIGSRWKQYLKTRLDKTVESPKYSYITLWESINGAMSWEKNPWVWVIEFEGIL